jgi:hypothetical protein
MWPRGRLRAVPTFPLGDCCVKSHDVKSLEAVHQCGEFSRTSNSGPSDKGSIPFKVTAGEALLSPWTLQGLPQKSLREYRPSGFRRRKRLPCSAGPSSRRLRSQRGSPFSKRSTPSQASCSAIPGSPAWRMTPVERLPLEAGERLAVEARTARTGKTRRSALNPEVLHSRTSLAYGYGTREEGSQCGI